MFNTLNRHLTYWFKTTQIKSLEEEIVMQIRSLAARMQAPGFFGVGGAGTTQIFSQYQRTEITIDGETTIEIEESHEIRRDFPF